MSDHRASTTPQAVLDAIEAAATLTQSVRETIESGRLDRLDDVLTLRGGALENLRMHLSTLGDPRTDDVEAALESLRAADLALLDWMHAEKKTTAAALGSIRGQRVDPYREQLVGPAVVNHHG